VVACPYIPAICPATSHPAEFAQAGINATGEAVHHPTLDAVADAETRCDSIANDVDTVKAYLLGYITDPSQVVSRTVGLAVPAEKLQDYSAEI